LAFAEAGFAAVFGFEDLLGLAGVGWAGLGEGGLDGWKILAFDDELDLGGVQGLTLEQGGCHAVHDVLVGVEDGVGRLISGVDEAADLSVDLASGLVGEVAVLRDLTSEEDLLLLLAEGHGAHLAHAELADHLAGEVGDALDVVAGTGGHLLEEYLFGAASAHKGGEARFEIFLGDGVLVFLGEVDRYAERHATGDDGDLVERVRVLTQRGDEGVTGLVIGGDLLLFVGEEHRLALGSHHDLVFSYFEVVHVDRFAVVAGGGEGGLVDHVGEVCSGEARCAASEDVEVDVFGHGDLLGVDLENLFAATDVGTIDDDAAIETARAEKRGVEDVGPVGRGDEDYAVVGLETVHFHQQLIQGLLALVMSAAKACATVTSDGVDFVDEDDAGGVLLALLEEVADAGCADAYEHLDEVRTGDGEEWDVGFASDCAGQEGLAGSRRSDEEDTLGDAAAEALELLRLAEELDDLLELFLGFVNSGDILESDLLLLHGEQTGAGLAEAHGLVAAGLHLAEEEEPEAEKQSEGRELDEEADPGVGVLVLDGDVDAMLAQGLIHVGVVPRNGGVVLSLFVAAILGGDIRAVDVDFGDLAGVGVVEQGGKADVLGLVGSIALDDELPKEDQAGDHEDPDQNLFDGRVQSVFPHFPVVQQLSMQWRWRSLLRVTGSLRCLHH
jgi:hypothetical protein